MLSHNFQGWYHSFIYVFIPRLDLSNDSITESPLTRAQNLAQVYVQNTFSLLATNLLVVGLDSGLKSLGVSADHLSNLVAALEEQESGHGADAEFLCDIRDLVDVELVEACVGVLVGHSERETC